jgi:hypothetical protein
MLYCNDCETDKEDDDFAWKNKAKGTRQSFCKLCGRGRAKAHYEANKDKYLEKARRNEEARKERNWRFIVEYLRTHPCVECDEPDILVLQFDHLRDKVLAVSELAARCGLERVIAEIAKCEVRCANCHARKTAKQLQFYRTKFI